MGLGRRGVSLWAAVTLVAGLSLAPQARAASRTPPATYRPGLELSPPVRLDPTWFGAPLGVYGPGEPVVMVDSGGVVFVAASLPQAHASPIWYSTDEGRSFSTLATPAGLRDFGPGGEGDLASDMAGHVYFVDMHEVGAVVTRWSDHGRRWDFTVPVATGSPADVDRPWLTVTADAVYLLLNHPSVGVSVERSTDGGLTWSTVWQSPLGVQAPWSATITSDPRTGAVYLIGRCTGFSDSRLCVLTTRDEGRAWSSPTLVAAAPRGTLSYYVGASAVDAAGNVYLAFASNDEVGCSVYVAVSPEAKTWRTFKVDPTGGCATYPWLAAAGPGRLAVSWYHTDVSASPDSVPINARWTWQAAVVVGADTPGPQVTYGTLDQVVHRGPLRRFFLDFQGMGVSSTGRFYGAFNMDTEVPCVDPGTATATMAAGNDGSLSNRCVFVAGSGLA